MKVWTVLVGLGTSLVLAEIHEIETISAILPKIDEKTLVFMDIDETLIESPIMLGGKAWRKHINQLLKTKISEEETERIHDTLTYLFAKRIPYIAVEDMLFLVLDSLYKKCIPVFALTARGKRHWYDMPAADAEALTYLHLKQAGISFPDPPFFVDKALFLHHSYGHGVFFTYPLEDKGELILSLFSKTHYRPNKIAFIDDKRENTLSVHTALQKLGIAAECFYYRHVDLFRPFDPLVAHIQLEKLFFEGTLLSDENAAGLKEQYAGIDAPALFLELIFRIMGTFFD